MANWKYASGSWVLGGNRDRFVDYSPNTPLTERVSLLSKIEGVCGIEIINPYDGIDVTELKKALKDNGMVVTSVLASKINDIKWKFGALINEDKALREEAIDEVMRSAELALELDCNMVNLWPGQDGYDYLFEINYDKAWENFRDSVERVAKRYPNVNFSIEYKPREPRVHCIIDSAAKTLLLCNDINLKNIGVTIDFGHSIIGGENPTEAAAISNSYNRLFHVHMNDNFGLWDDDLISGTVHLWHTLEFLMYLKSIDYSGWVSLDISPFREDSFNASKLSFDIIKKMERIVDSLDVEEFKSIRSKADAVESYSKLFDLFIK